MTRPTPKKLENRRKLARLLLPRFRKLFPNPRSELHYETPFQFAVAVILSAQCTDKRVNEVTKTLFRKYKTVSDFAGVEQTVLEREIFSTGFYRNKARNIIALAKILKSEFDGELPNTLNKLIALPGIGRKTANVILSNIFGINEGIAIDTHAIRFARKFGLTDHRDPYKIERDLMEIFPQKEWGNLNHYMVLYGRYICPAWKAECVDILTEIYPKAIYKLKD